MSRASQSAMTSPMTTTITHIKASDLTSSSAVISWVTNVTADGCVNYGSGSASEHSACESGSGVIHLVELTNLLSQTTYQFEIVSGGMIDNHGGSYYSFSTTAAGRECRHWSMARCWIQTPSLRGVCLSQCQCQ